MEARGYLTLVVSALHLRSYVHSSFFYLHMVLACLPLCLGLEDGGDGKGGGRDNVHLLPSNFQHGFDANYSLPFQVTSNTLLMLPCALYSLKYITSNTLLMLRSSFSQVSFNTLLVLTKPTMPT